MPNLGVNVDHIATLRQARGGLEPDPVLAARICETAGCDSIVAHLREDRRHMQDKDLYLLRKTVKTRLNMEMSIAAEIVAVALDLVPGQVTLVPERRKELTTEGGLDCVKYGRRIETVTGRLKTAGITVSLFVDPVKSQVKAAAGTGAEFIEIHTGEYSNASDARSRREKLKKLENAAAYAMSIGLRVNSGHGLNYLNVRDVARIRGMEELNIGHSIISRAAFVGLERAVKEMIALIR
jgi:pyridoxine 5-phosphate synthase